MCLEAKRITRMDRVIVVPTPPPRTGRAPPSYLQYIPAVGSYETEPPPAPVPVRRDPSFSHLLVIDPSLGSITVLY